MSDYSYVTFGCKKTLQRDSIREFSLAPVTTYWTYTTRKGKITLPRQKVSAPVTSITGSNYGKVMREYYNFKKLKPTKRAK